MCRPSNYRNDPKFSDKGLCKQCRPRSDRSSLIRVYTICHSIYTFWTIFSFERPLFECWSDKSKHFGCPKILDCYSILEFFQIARQEREQLEGCCYKQNLFSSVGPIYVSGRSQPPRQALVQLIKLCGGQVSFAI